ncbi:hypothetical protein BLLJ_0922 [Bifidobacterium longum subsp. longum JCM 1217]|nr:hypothetical protein BLSL_0912 [Bifidobacterium longum subsp. longum]BAJ66590.1 hypothetical protein BLLJ_0922 [Bifidobacterium longum subsp. longum JCM 1217]
MQDPHARDHAHVVDHVGRVPRDHAHTPAHGDRDRAHRPGGGPARPRPPSSDTRGKRERGADGRWERRCRLVCPSLQDGPAAVRSRSCAVFAAAWFALRRR